jgi:ubiquinone/menaquinone biosynthesis C-methylase UbiE
MKPKQYICCNEIEKIPNIAFRLMTFMKWFFRPWLVKRLDLFGIQPGQTVIDYGCGPGFFLKKTSELVGETGMVYAADIHPLAIKSVEKLTTKHHLTNVKPVLIDGYNTGLDNHCADVIFVLDTFHMIKDPNALLTELHRLLKKGGHLIIDEGHQPREQAKEKILNSKLWNIAEESKNHLKCTPV